MKKSLLALCALSMASSLAFAQDTSSNPSPWMSNLGFKPYVRGQLHYNDNNFGTNSSFHSDVRRTGGAVFGGVQWSPYFGIETGYVDLGRTDFSVQSFQVGKYDPYSSASVYAIPLRAVGTYPVTSKFDVHGKLGVAYVHADLKQPLWSSLPSDVSSTRATYGLGVSYKWTNNLAITVDYDRYQLHTPNKNSNLDTFGVGLKYAF